MFGMDISHYQDKIDLRKGKYDFCIIKATEGIGFIDKSFNSFSDQLTELNKPIGCYHFARPDLHGSIQGMKDEAFFFCNTVKSMGLYGKVIAVLDWEKEPFDRPDLIEAWTNTVEATLHTIPFIYGSKSKMNKWKSYPIIKKHPLWIAAWPNNKSYEVGKDPGLKLPIFDLKYHMWQYSSVGSYPGFNGNVDLDYCSLTVEGWNQWAGMNRKIDVEQSDSELTDDMKWAIEVGLIKGYGDGKYGSKDALTREQAATMFRRFYNIFIEK